MLVDGFQVTCAEPIPPTALTALGIEGTSPGTTAFDGPESGPVPAALVAFTVNV
jgi:hypothetical protein